MSLLAKLLLPSPSSAPAAATRLDDEGHWLASTAGRPTQAGVAVTEQGALQVPVVYSAIGLISENLAQLPVDVLRRVGKRRVPQSGHPLEAILNSEINPYMAAFTGRSVLQAHVLGWGNGYAEVERTKGGDLWALWPLFPSNTRPEVEGRAVRFRTTAADGGQRLLDYNKVLHIPALGFDGLVGYSPIQLARNAIGLAIAAEIYGSKFFANDAKSGGFVEHPAKLNEDGVRNLRNFVNEQGGLEEAHRIKVLQEGAKFHATTVPPEDAQFLATRQYQVEEIARLYRVPLHMLQSHSKDTAWGSGIAQMQMGFLVYSLATWIVRWEQELSRKLLTSAEREAGFFVRHNVGGLLRGDAKTRAEVYQLALESGWLKVNEVRELEDRDPYEGDEVDVATLDPAVPR